MVETTLIEHSMARTELLYYEKFPNIQIRVHSGENILTGKKWSDRKVEPRGTPTKKVYLEELVKFRKSIKIELPYSVEAGYDRFRDDEYVVWYEAQFGKKSKKEIVEIDAEDIELGDEI